MKKELLDYCHSFCCKRLDRIQVEIKKISDSLTSETKSSAGDKHETGRAMLQLEREKLGAQLAQAEQMEKALAKVSIENSTEKVGLGSLVKTNMATYFLSISAGKYQIEETVVFCISPSTPIGRLLLGKSVGDAIHFNGMDQVVLNVD